jgi:dipeptide transport system ATP-binding protein
MLPLETWIPGQARNDNSMTVVVEAKNLRQVYRIRRGMFREPAFLQAVGGVSFAIEAGKTLAVVGESGCGKSTLARMVALIEKPAEGTLMLAGKDAVDTPASDRRTLRQAVQLVFQNPYGSLNPRKKISAVLEDPLAINTTLGKAERKERALAMLAQVGLRPEYAARYPHMFSGGQRQRIAIARAMILKPKVVVLDEPTSALDRSVQKQIVELLRKLQADHELSYLFISHDLAVVRAMADYIIVMKQGKIVEEGPTEAIFSNPQAAYTQTLMAAAIDVTRFRLSA